MSCIELDIDFLSWVRGVLSVREVGCVKREACLKNFNFYTVVVGVKFGSLNLHES